MDKDNILDIIEKYFEMSEKEYRYGAEKCALYERIAHYLEENIDKYIEDDYFQDELELINAVKDELEEMDGFYDEEDWENMDLDSFMEE